ncbi:MAG: hypothetical protein GY937_20120 [bacterium]|nr:hypothetical protein [bacterium]
MKPSNLLMDIQNCGLNIPEQKDALYLITYLAAKAYPDKVLTTSARLLMKALGYSGWTSILHLLEALEEGGCVAFRELNKKRKSRKAVADLFGDPFEEVTHVNVVLVKHPAWFGNERKRTPDPFQHAYKKYMAKLDVLDPEAATRAPTSDKVRHYWEWWRDKFKQYHEQILGKRVDYKAERSFDQDLAYISELVTMDDEIVWRAAKAVLKGETSGWNDQKGRPWWLAGQRTIRAWLEGAKLLLHRVTTFQQFRVTGVMEEFYKNWWEGKLTFEECRGLYQLAEVDLKEAMALAKEIHGLEFSPQEAGLGGVPEHISNRVNGVIKEAPKTIENPSLFDLTDEDGHGEKRVGAEKETKFKGGMKWRTTFTKSSSRQKKLPTDRTQE